jgi:hypothetical protein
MQRREAIKMIAAAPLLPALTPLVSQAGEQNWSVCFKPEEGHFGVFVRFSKDICCVFNGVVGNSNTPLLRIISAYSNYLPHGPREEFEEAASNEYEMERFLLRRGFRKGDGFLWGGNITTYPPKRANRGKFLCTARYCKYKDGVMSSVVSNWTEKWEFV